MHNTFSNLEIIPFKRMTCNKISLSNFAVFHPTTPWSNDAVLFITYAQLKMEFISRWYATVETNYMNLGLDSNRIHIRTPFQVWHITLLWKIVNINNKSMQHCQWSFILFLETQTALTLQTWTDENSDQKNYFQKILDAFHYQCWQSKRPLPINHSNTIKI